MAASVDTPHLAALSLINLTKGGVCLGRLDDFRVLSLSDILVLKVGEVSNVCSGLASSAGSGVFVRMRSMLKSVGRCVGSCFSGIAIAGTPWLLKLVGRCMGSCFSGITTSWIPWLLKSVERCVSSCFSGITTFGTSWLLKSVGRNVKSCFVGITTSGTPRYWYIVGCQNCDLETMVS